MSPFTMQTFFPTGNINNFQICQIPTRIIQAILIPREELTKVVSERLELSRTGIYFLFSDIDNNSLNGENQVYIGESENVGIRLKQHLKKEMDWEVAVVITTINNDNQLTKADIKFLENYSYTKTLEANRFQLDQTVPTKPFIYESREADLVDIFQTIEIFTSYLGYPLFQSKPSDKETEEEEDDLLYFNQRGTEAIGFYSSEGLTVKKGSVRAQTHTKGFKREKLLSKLIMDGVVSDSGEFLKNYTFSSPSTAADIVGGASYNGWKVWRDKNNIILDELYQRP